MDLNLFYLHLNFMKNQVNFHYCQQIRVSRFNLATYDLNLVKLKLAKHLEIDLFWHNFVVQKNKAYFCLSNDDFRFLDITQYLSHGTSNSRFLKGILGTGTETFLSLWVLPEVWPVRGNTPSPSWFWLVFFPQKKSVLDDGTRTKFPMVVQKTWRKEDIKSF